MKSDPLLPFHSSSANRGTPAPEYQRNFGIDTADIASSSEPLPSYGTHTRDIRRHVPSNKIQPAPAYTEQPDPVAELYNFTFLYQNLEQPKAEMDLQAWKTFSEQYAKIEDKPSGTSNPVKKLGTVAEQNREQLQIDKKDRRIVTRFFLSIEAGHQDVIEFVINQGIVTPNTPSFTGGTPLLLAVKLKNIAVLRQLIDLGADVDMFGKIDTSVRIGKRREFLQCTPLQLAASIGHLVLVKILIEKYHADDSLIAPDGQIALRLAAENGHREVVDYLPSRRGGGFKRWKFKNRVQLDRIKRASVAMYHFGKFFVWDIEKFFFWTLPKNYIVKPARKFGVWCWTHKGELGPWITRQARMISTELCRSIKVGVRGTWEFFTATLPSAVKSTVTGTWGFLTHTLPNALKLASVWTWRFLIKATKTIWTFLITTLPSAIKSTALAVWGFFTTTAPKAIKATSIWIYHFLTITLVKVLSILTHWLYNGLLTTSQAIFNILTKTLSFFSTFISALLSFFHRITLTDIWNGFCDVLTAVFVQFPTTLWRWIEKFGEVSYRTLDSMFGIIGEVLWYIGWGVVSAVMYVPKQLWRIVGILGGVCVRAGYEIWVWFDPKAS